MVFHTKCKICFGCVAFWFIDSTASVEIGISASVTMDFSDCDCWMSESLEKKLSDSKDADTKTRCYSGLRLDLSFNKNVLHLCLMEFRP